MTRKPWVIYCLPKVILKTTIQCYQSTFSTNATLQSAVSFILHKMLSTCVHLPPLLHVTLCSSLFLYFHPFHKICQHLSFFFFRSLIPYLPNTTSSPLFPSCQLKFDPLTTLPHWGHSLPLHPRCSRILLSLQTDMQFPGICTDNIQHHPLNF